MPMVSKGVGAPRRAPLYLTPQILVFAGLWSTITFHGVEERGEYKEVSNRRKGGPLITLVLTNQV